MAKTKRGLGRPSIFRGKMADDGTLHKGADRVQGVLTPVGSLRFEEARRHLAILVDVEPETVSDADTIEALARGWPAVKLYLKQR